LSKCNPPVPPVQSPAEEFFTRVEDITARRQVVGLYLPGREPHYAVRESWLAQLAKGHVEPLAERRAERGEPLPDLFSEEDWARWREDHGINNQTEEE
jgi:hypothetical protein